MRGTQWRWMVLAVLAVLVATSCTNNDLDDGDSPNVVLEITELDFSEGVEGEPELGECKDAGGGGTLNPCLSTADCPDGEFCDLPVTVGECDIPEWSLTFTNVPKTDLATTSPFNDVVLEQASFTYFWPPPVASFSPLNGTVTIPLGLVVPAEGTAQLDFEPISQSQLGALGAEVSPAEAISVQINIVFEGEVIDSDSISVSAGGVLSIDPCY